MQHHPHLDLLLHLHLHPDLLAGEQEATVIIKMVGVAEAVAQVICLILAMVPWV